MNLANEIAIAFANVFLLVAGFSNSSRDQYTSGRRTETDPRSMENLGESRAIYRIPPSTWESIFRPSNPRSHGFWRTYNRLPVLCTVFEHATLTKCLISGLNKLVENTGFRWTQVGANCYKLSSFPGPQMRLHFIEGTHCPRTIGSKTMAKR